MERSARHFSSKKACSSRTASEHSLLPSLHGRSEKAASVAHGLTCVGFIAISLTGAVIGAAMGWNLFAVTASTAFIAVAFVGVMTNRMKKPK